ncbi:MAG TPA: hypothetical protein DCY13_10845 [Verrucomicrobiales bacterium]|nr:hypothetical protein [Verrucomicrobiales bacterium]
METLPETQIFKIERPHPKLMTYYFITCLLTGPLFPILILPAYFRYRSMRYRFDDEGVAMRWGILWRRENLLNYAKIQDIHLSSGLIQRWLGLASIQIQTASGSSTAEMTIEGLLEFEAIRDFLYSKMRGQKEKTAAASLPAAESLPTNAQVSLSGEELRELIDALRDGAGELRQIRELLAVRGSLPQPPKEG